MLLWLLPVFLVFLMIGMPVALGLLLAPGALVGIFGDGNTPSNFKAMAGLYRNLFNGMDNFALMALPFFLLAGDIMNRGGITNRLVEFAQAFMGHLRGGLAHVNILSSMLFAGLSGSAVADTSALGSTLIPAMEKNGYTRRFAAAVTAASSVIGPIIPPSGIMIIYAYVMEESVAALFAAGIVPGILVGVGLMLVVRLMADRYDLPKAERIVNRGQTVSGVESLVASALIRINLAAIFLLVTTIVSSIVGAPQYPWISFLIFLPFAHFVALWLRKQVSEDFRVVVKRAMAPLQTPIIILGGILTGWFTPTEASVIAVIYALIISFGILRSMTTGDLWQVLGRAAISSSAVLLLVGAAVAFKTVVALSHLPETMTEFILSLSDNPLIILFLINILLFIVGMFLDAGPAIIILAPILGTVFLELGVHPVHFAIIMSVNLTVGLATPPMGLVLFVASAVSKEKVEVIAKAILPFLAVEVLVIFLITYFPFISMTVPRLLGYVD